MRIRTDDEVYRVDAVWLGPPQATFPWRARYVAWGVGIMVFLLVLAVERRMNIGFSFFSTAWAVVITIALTRIICSRITHERPLGAVTVMWLRELTAPRETTSGRGGAVSAARLRVRNQRPRPKQSRKQASMQAKRSDRSNKQAGRSRQPAAQNAGARNPAAQNAGAQNPAAQNPAVRNTGTRNTGTRRRVQSKEVRGVRSSARP